MVVVVWCEGGGGKGEEVEGGEGGGVYATNTSLRVRTKRPLCIHRERFSVSHSTHNTTHHTTTHHNGHREKRREDKM